MQLVMAATHMVGVWILCRWLPDWGFDWLGVRSMLAFGGNLTGVNLLYYVSRNIDNVLIGKFWGVQQLGLYAKAYQLLLLPLMQINAPISRVAVPALSRLVQEPERYRQAYLRILAKVCLFTLPLVAWMIGSSDWLILVILGPKWQAASGLFALLGFVALIQPIGYTTTWLYTTQDRTWEQLQWGVLGSSLSVLSIVAGLPWGAVGVAASYGLSGLLIRTPLQFWYVGRAGWVRTADLYRTALPFFCAALGILLSLGIFRLYGATANVWVNLAASLLVAILSGGFILGIIPAGRETLRDLIHTVRLLRPSA
jgi:PST family polysaccharide transporter